MVQNAHRISATNNFIAATVLQILYSTRFPCRAIISRFSRIPFGRNPNKPKNEVVIPERAVVKFRAGKELKEAVEKLDPKKF